MFKTGSTLGFIGCGNMAMALISGYRGPVDARRGYHRL